jgi:two-component system cell cycle sensor histidine kinase/response regulator CckA
MIHYSKFAELNQMSGNESKLGVLRNHNVPSFCVDLSGSILEVNPAFTKLLYADNEETLIGQSISQFIKGKVTWTDWLNELMSEGEKSHSELNCLNWKGEALWVQSFSKAQNNQAGKPYIIIGSWVDISSKKLATQETKRILEVIKQAPISLMLTDLQGSIYYVNSHFTKISGFRSDEVLGKTPKFLKSDLHTVSYYKKLWYTLRQGKIWNGVFINKRKDGSLFYEDATLFPLVNSSNVPVGYAAVKLDITQQYKMQQEILKYGDILRSVFNNMQEGLVRLHVDGIVDMINPALIRILGLDPDADYTGEDVFDLMRNHPIDIRELIHNIKENRTLKHQIYEAHPIFYRVNGQLVSSATEEPHIIISVENISEEKMLERQLIQAQKAEALSQITGGIIHDFNNLLANIASATYLMEGMLEGNEEASELFSIIDNNVNRGKTITHRMMAFITPENPKTKPISTTQVLQNLSEIVSHSLPKNVHFRYETMQVEDYFLADFQQIEQMFINILINASEAMPNGGIIDMEVYNPCPPDMYHGDAEKSADSYVLMVIKDSGKGIANKNLSKIFEPFYSTKPVGKGTGLGLSVVKKIIEINKGWIHVESQLGFGTTIYLAFPAIDMPKNEDISQPVEAASLEHLKFPKDRRPNIMIIEDEKELRHLLTSLLTEMGAEVENYDQAGVALDMYDPRQYDLVITDLGLPDINGTQVIEMILAQNPDQKLVAITGFLSDNIFEILEKLGVRDVEKKPFDMHHFVQLVYNRVMEEHE